MPTLKSLLLPLLVSQLCLAGGRRDPRRGRGGRRHRARDADDSLELLQAAENGRYKVVAKAEPYKNLPPAPATPEYGDYLDVTPSPLANRKYKPTQPPSEELKFALLNNAKTQKYVPVRQTPAYEVTTPTYSVTPPALEFEPTPAELKLKGKHSKSFSNPQHTRFKISV